MSFSQGAAGLSQLPSCLEWIIGVTVESVQGNAVYLEWIWTLGSFRIVARPMEFLSSFMLRLAPLEVRQERREMEPHLKMRRENVAFLELWQDPQCSFQVDMGMWGTS